MGIKIRIRDYLDKPFVSKIGIEGVFIHVSIKEDVQNITLISRPK